MINYGLPIAVALLACSYYLWLCSSALQSIARSLEKIAHPWHEIEVEPKPKEVVNEHE